MIPFPSINLMNCSFEVNAFNLYPSNSSILTPKQSANLGNVEISLKHGKKRDYYIDTEKFSTNAQIAKIGEYFADCICENALEYDVIIGFADFGIPFSVATECALFNKYGITVDCCYDRKVSEEQERIVCGHTLRDKERVVIVDAVISSGRKICKKIECLKEIAEIDIVAIIVIADLTDDVAREQKLGNMMLQEKYGANVYSIITDEDVSRYLEKNGF